MSCSTRPEIDPPGVAPQTAASPPQATLAAALRALVAAPEDAVARLSFHAALSASEVCLWLDFEPSDGADRLSPRLFPLEAGPTALAFDNEAALAGFAGTAAPYAALPGRVLVAMLARTGGVSLLVQAEDGAAELLTPEAVDWLARTLDQPAPAKGQGQPAGYRAPDLPAAELAALVPALERRLSGLPGLESVWLAGVAWQDGRAGHLLALSGLPAAAEPAVARAVAEALELSGAGQIALDVVFPPAAALGPIAAAGLRLTPAPYAPPAEPAPPAAPGMDPARPPRLR